MAGRADRVQVVEHEHERLLELLEALEQRAEEGLQRSGGRRSERGQGRLGGTERQHHVVPEAAPVGVLAAQRQPGRATRPAALGEPAREQHRLAPAGGGGDQRDLPLCPPIEEVQDPPSLDEARGLMNYGRPRSPFRCEAADQSITSAGARQRAAFTRTG